MVAEPPLLEIDAVDVQYGSVRVVDGVSLRLALGERHALLGTNGAGKSTLFNAITGTVRPCSGRIAYKGRDLTGISVHGRARLGMGRTFQTSLSFADRSVAENLRVAMAGRCGPRLGLRFWRHYTGLAERTARCMADFELEAIAQELVGTLSYGQQREVEIAMALAGGPELLLLDEPAAGLSPQARGGLVRRLQALPRSVTLLFVEHDMDVALSLADRVTVMRDGRVVATGSPADIRRDPVVREMYLGTRH
jgi:branched-chain amino acid transport system ATP-binding protein